MDSNIYTDGTLLVKTEIWSMKDMKTKSISKLVFKTKKSQFLAYIKIVVISYFCEAIKI